MLSFLSACVCVMLGFALRSAAMPQNFNPTGPVSELDYWPSWVTPAGGESWQAGETYTVSWSNSFPAGASVGQTANILLGFVDSTGENLDYTLATNVSLYPPANPCSCANITLPNIGTSLKTTYVLDLLGSSGDISNEFTIVPQVEVIGPVSTSIPPSKKKRMISKQPNRLDVAK